MILWTTARPTKTATWARSDEYTGLEDETLIVDATAGVLANDSDPQGDEMTAVLTRNIREGTLTLNPDGSFTYEPDENFFGSDAFTYLANDGLLDSQAATVTVTVEAVNDPPVAVDDSFDVESGKTLETTVETYATTVLIDSPAAYWQFDESTGTNVSDASGAHDGTIHGGALPGQPSALPTGHSLQFDGIDDYVIINGDFTRNDFSGNSYSIELLFNTNRTAVQDLVAIARTDGVLELILIELRQNGSIFFLNRLPRGKRGLEQPVLKPEVFDGDLAPLGRGPRWP